MDKFHCRTAFGLGFDVEFDESVPSGFKPSELHLGTGLPLYSDLRLQGFARLINYGFAEELIIVSGNAGRYKDHVPPINQAIVIREMLIKEHGVREAAVRAVPSSATTGGNTEAIASIIRGEPLDPKDCAVITNHYHIPRAVADLSSAGMALAPLPAEAVWLAAVIASTVRFESERDLLSRRFGASAYSSRVMEEIVGMARKLAGTFIPRTDNSQPHPYPR